MLVWSSIVFILSLLALMEFWRSFVALKKKTSLIATCQDVDWKDSGQRAKVNVCLIKHVAQAKPNGW